MAKKKKRKVQIGPFVTEMTPEQVDRLLWLLWGI